MQFENTWIIIQWANEEIMDNKVEISLEEYERLKRNNDMFEKDRNAKREYQRKLSSIAIRVDPKFYQQLQEYALATNIPIRQLILQSLEESYGIRRT